MTHIPEKLFMNADINTVCFPDTLLTISGKKVFYGAHIGSLHLPETITGHTWETFDHANFDIFYLPDAFPDYHVRIDTSNDLEHDHLTAYRCTRCGNTFIEHQYNGRCWRCNAMQSEDGGHQECFDVVERYSIDGTLYYRIAWLNGKLDVGDGSREDFLMFFTDEHMQIVTEPRTLEKLLTAYLFLGASKTLPPSCMSSAAIARGNADLAKDLMLKEEILERYVAELRQELVPFRSAAVYDAETKEAVRLIKQ